MSPIPQRRGRSIAMSAAERDAFLREQRTCRVATVAADGTPHVTPLWFAWDGEHIWLHSVVRSARWAHLARHPAVAVVVDAGRDYGELRGVEMRGRAVVVGEVPRTGASCPEVATAEELFATKYSGGAMVFDGRHGWLRIDVEREVSWDFRKLAGL